MKYITSIFYLWISLILQMTVIKYINFQPLKINLVFITIFLLSYKKNYKIALFSGIFGGLLLDIISLNKYGINTIIGIWISGLTSIIIQEKRL